MNEKFKDLDPLCMASERRNDSVLMFKELSPETI